MARHRLAVPQRRCWSDASWAELDTIYVVHLLLILRFGNLWKILASILWVLSILCEFGCLSLSLTVCLIECASHLHSLSRFEHVTFNPTPLPCHRKLENNICRVVYAYGTLGSDVRYRARVCGGPQLGRNPMCAHPWWGIHVRFACANAYYNEACYNSSIARENMTRWSITR